MFRFFDELVSARMLDLDQSSVKTVAREKNKKTRSAK